jgi:hypothetical protein
VAHETPVLKTITLTNANTNYQLSALLNALDGDIAHNPLSSRCTYLQLQFDVNAGSDVLLIGNADLSATNFGVQLVGTQAWPVQSMDSNLIRLDQIYLRCTGPSRVVYVAMLTR